MQKDFDFDFFMETSAKTGLNAQELFVEAGKLLYKEYAKYKKKQKKTVDKLKNEDEGGNKNKQKKGCCN